MCSSVARLLVGSRLHFEDWHQPQAPQLLDPPSTGCRLLGFRDHELACLHDVQHRVYTIMAYGLQRELALFA